jgi:hypothetical protein
MLGSPCATVIVVQVVVVSKGCHCAAKKVIRISFLLEDSMHVDTWISAVQRKSATQVGIAFYTHRHTHTDREILWRLVCLLTATA